MASAHWSRKRSLTGHAGVVSSTVTLTAQPSRETLFTNPNETMSRFRSGSMTDSSALRTSGSEMGHTRSGYPAEPAFGSREEA